MSSVLPVIEREEAIKQTLAAMSAALAGVVSRIGLPAVLSSSNAAAMPTTRTLGASACASKVVALCSAALDNV